MITDHITVCYYLPYNYLPIRCFPVPIYLIMTFYQKLCLMSFRLFWLSLVYQQEAYRKYNSECEQQRGSSAPCGQNVNCRRSFLLDQQGVLGKSSAMEVYCTPVALWVEFCPYTMVLPQSWVSHLVWISDVVLTIDKWSGLTIDKEAFGFNALHRFYRTSLSSDLL